MKGLLRNNFLAASSSAMVFAAFLLLWGIFIVALPNTEQLIGFGLSAMAGFSINGIFSVQRESSSRWGKYKLTAPVRRADVVKSYYIAQLAWLLTGLSFAAAVTILSRISHKWLFDLSLLPMIALGISVSLFLSAIFFPLLYWGGEERGEAFLVIALFSAIALNVGLIMVLNLFLAGQGIITTLLGSASMIACSALAFALSYPLTIAIYRRREY